MKAWVTSFFLASCLLFGCSPSDPTPVGSGPSLAEILLARDAIRTLDRPMGPPREGEWLVSHYEAGQTFEQYIRSNPNRPSPPSRSTLYIQPIGRFEGASRDIIAPVAEALKDFYGCPVTILLPIDESVLPESAKRVHPSLGVPQLDSLAILDYLRDHRPNDAVAVLALTSVDLWPNERGKSWNFVFGQASLRDRVGVWSIARHGNADEDFAKVLRRALKVAIHETGHMLGIDHCTAAECGMNGSNNLRENDRQPTEVCSECERKVWWSCRTPIVGRYAKLADFARRNGLAAEQKAWEAARAAITVPSRSAGPK